MTRYVSETYRLLDRLTLSGDDVQDLYAVCQAVGIVITLEDIRDALETEEK